MLKNILFPILLSSFILNAQAQHSLNVCTGNMTTSHSLDEFTTAATIDSYSSNNPAVATISYDTIRGLSAGIAVVTYSRTTLYTRTVIVTPRPSASLPALVNTCSGSPLSFSAGDTTTGNAYLWQGPDGFTATDRNPVITAATTRATGTYSLTVTCPFGCNNTYTVSAVVNESPGAITGAGSYICAGNTLPLRDTTAGGTWSSSNTAVATVGTGGVVSGLSTGTAAITYTLGSGCNSVATVTVGAPLPAITGPSEVCRYATVTMANAAPGGTWSGASGVGVIVVGSATGTVMGYGTRRGSQGEATVIYSTGAGCRTTKTMTVYQQPGAIEGAPAVCVSSTVTLSNVINSGIWTSSNPAVATVDSGSAAYLGMVSGVAAGTTVLTYTVGGACRSMVAVTVTALPAAITGSRVVCTGAIVSMSSATAGGTWSSSDTRIAIVGSATGVVNGFGTPSGHASGTANITYKVGPGCVSTATITVYQQPTAITGTPITCAGASATVYNGMSWGVWSCSNPAIATIDSAEYCHLGRLAGVSAGTTTITYTIGRACSAVTTVTIAPSPAPITGAHDICTGTTATLANAVSGGSWSSSNTFIANVDVATGAVYGTGTPTGSTAGIATISYTYAGCAATKTVTVYQQPHITTGATSVCRGATVTLYCDYGQGAWSTSDISLASVDSGMDAATGIVTGLSSGSTSVTYTIGGTCTAVATVNVEECGGRRAYTGTTDGTGIGATEVGSAMMTAIAGTATSNTMRMPTTNSTASKTISTATPITSIVPAINIYPNPSTGIFNIRTVTPGTLYLMAADGTLVKEYTAPAGDTMFDRPQHLTAGTYICKFAGSDGNSHTEKIVFK